LTSTAIKVIFELVSSAIGITDGAYQLATDLVSSWYLDETSGTRYDSWNGNDLAEVNVVGYTTGKIGNAATFVIATGEQLVAANDVTLQTGDIDFMFTGWFKLENGAVAQKVWCKCSEDTNEREYLLRIKSSGQVAWSVSRNGTIKTELTYPNVLSTDVWYFVCVYHDSVGNELGISVDNGTFTTVSYSFGVYTGSADFVISGEADGNYLFEGAVDAVHFWKRLLETSEISEMYNGGDGRQIPPFGP
jgi:hypothetical protein